MESTSGNVENIKSSSEDMFGELNALLNVITASETESSKPDHSIDVEESENASKKEENIDDDADNLEGKEISSKLQDSSIDKIPSEALENLESSDENLEKVEDSIETLNKDCEIFEKSESLETPNDKTENPDEKTETLENKTEESEMNNASEKKLDSNSPELNTENMDESVEISVEKSLEVEGIEKDEKTSEDIASKDFAQASPTNLEETSKSPSESDEEKVQNDKEEKLTESATFSDIENKNIETTGDETAKSSVNSEKPETSEESTKKRSESPNELIDMLKKLSPEKLEEIKSKIFENDNKKKLEFEEQDKMEVDSTATKAPENPPNKPDDDCVILLDSDDEETDPPPAKPEVNPKEVEKKEEPVKVPEPATSSELKRKQDDDKENKSVKQPRKTKECVNPDCPCESEEFFESPQFILSFYYTTKKPHKAQYVCMSCHDKAILKYEELGKAMVNNMPMFQVQIHKKHEMVEIIDSDDEDGQSEARVVPDSEKVIFDCGVELEVEEILQNLCNKIDFKKQLGWDEENVKKGIDKIDLEQSLFDEELKKLEKQSSTMYNELYSINKPRIQRRPSLDIFHEIEPRQMSEIPTFRPTGYPQPGTKVVINPPQRPPQTSPKVLPPPRLILPQTPIEGSPYALKTRLEGKMQNWAPCKLLEKLPGVLTYRVQFFDSNITIVNGKEFAKSAINLGLTIGARVIALFSTKPTKHGKNATRKFLPGVIGEKRSKYNKFRYLVFCDYGQVQYVHANDVREISESSPNVVDDVHRNLKQFIQDYLHSQTQGQRPLLNVRLGQKVVTERNSAWLTANVVEVDCSLVRMHFPRENVSEWIYRGSKRFGPIFAQQQQRGANKNARRNDPNISYITVDSDEEQQAENAQEQQETVQAEEVKRNTARKSTAPPPPPQRPQQPHPGSSQGPQPQQSAASGSTSVQKTIILNDNNIYLEDPNKVTKHRHFTPRKDIAAKKYEKHTCSMNCLRKHGNLSVYSPLTKPLLTCWERQIVRQKTNKWIVYKAPCGRRLRNMYEIRRYLMITQCPLNVDNFDFDINMQVLAAYDVADKNLCPLYIPDMSEGKEGMKIPVVNAFDDTAPPKLVYSPSRIPMKGVHINTDPDFMACCDCTDDCADKTKCACFQMTIRGYKFATRDETQPDEDISYVWKRLLAQVSTGIYECHSSCKCSSRCLNKVVQHPIQIKMQLYRTKNRGWGLESCHDIPKGTFVCIYAGRLYTEDDANALCQGLDHGDEYFAELDLIETAAMLKEDFEAGVINPDSETEDENSDSDYDEKSEVDGDFMSTAKAKGDREIITRSARGSRNTTSTDERSRNDSDSEDDIVNMQPSGGNTSGVSPKTRSLRKLYGKNEKVYIMDAKTCGNVGRYFNHSCDPNLFVQSVFVDTHDLRFPWIAFFAARPIKAGEELTWNYNYEVGSVASKVLYCKCGAKNCRGRIL